MPHRNSNNIFKYIRNLTHSKSLPSVIHLDDEVAESDTDSANMFNHYFHSVFSDSTKPSSTYNLLEPTDHINYIDSISITVYDTLVSLDPSKAQGIDLISPKVIQTCAPILCKLCTIFSQCPLNTHGRSTRLYQFSKLVIKLQLRTTDLFHCSLVYQKFLSD